MCGVAVILGILGDTHLRDTIPRNRVDVDDYYDLQFKKIEQCLKIFKSQKCVHIIHCGDMFDFHRVSFQLLLDTIRFFQKHKLKLWGVVGSHDVTGYNIESLKNSPLGVLIQLGFYGFVDDMEKVLGGIKIKGVNCAIHDSEDNYTNSDLIVTHNMVLPMEKAPFEHIYHKTLDNSSLRCLIVGHYHQPWMSQEKNTLFIDPGATMRMDINDSFHPGVVILDTETLKAKRIELDVEPYEKVFREQKESEDVLEIGTVELSKVDKQNVEERIMSYAKENGYEDNVIDNAVLRVKKAKETIL